MIKSIKEFFKGVWNNLTRYEVIILSLASVYLVYKSYAEYALIDQDRIVTLTYGWWLIGILDKCLSFVLLVWIFGILSERYQKKSTETI